MIWSAVLVRSIILHLKGKLTFLSFNSFLQPFDPSDNKVIRTSKEGEAEALPEIRMNKLHSGGEKSFGN